MNDRYHVYITQPIPEKAIQFLKEREYCVSQNLKDRVLSHIELIQAVADKDAVLCLLTDKIDAEVLKHASKTKIFANCAVGYDNIAVDHATDLGIAVTNTPGVLTETTAELTWALILAVCRRIVPADRYVREGKFTHWGPLLFLGSDLSGKTLGILGCGRIGSAVARMSKGFQMKVLYYDCNRQENLEKEIGAEKVDISTLLQQSDFLTIHLSLNSSTRHLIGEKELAQMKKTAYLINTARGAIVDEDALIHALKKGQIAGAGLDVYEYEPRVPSELMKMEQVVLLPHIGSATLETRTKMAMMAAENIVAILEEKPVPNLVNPEVIQRENCRWKRR